MVSANRGFEQLALDWYISPKIGRGLRKTWKRKCRTRSQVPILGWPNMVCSPAPLIFRSMNLSLNSESSRVRNSLGPSGIPQARKISGTAMWPSSLVVLIGLSPHHTSLSQIAQPTPLNCKNQYLQFTLAKENCSPASNLLFHLGVYQGRKNQEVGR